MILQICWIPSQKIKEFIIWKLPFRCFFFLKKFLTRTDFILKSSKKIFNILTHLLPVNVLPFLFDNI